MSQDKETSPLVEIDPSEFRVPSEDDKGHDARLSVRVHKNVPVQIQRIYDSKWFPYKTTHQIVRHALRKHFEWIETLAPITNSNLHRTNAMMEIVYEEEEQDRFVEVIEKMAKQIGQYLSKGRVDRARSLVNRVFEQVEQMPEGTWKDQYRDEIKERFGYLLKKEEGKSEDESVASLLDLGQED